MGPVPVARTTLLIASRYGIGGRANTRVSSSDISAKLQRPRSENQQGNIDCQVRDGSVLLFPATQLVTHPDLSFPFHAVVYNFAAAGQSVRGRSVGDNIAVVSIFEVVLQFQELAISTRVDALDLRWAQNGAHRCQCYA
jgi:hypothetical protein